MPSPRNLSLVLAVAVSTSAFKVEAAPPTKLAVPIGPSWEILSLFSGKVSYYNILEEAGTKMWHARARLGLDNVILHTKLDSPHRYNHLRWRWRVQRFPIGADERVDGIMDNAAAVYVFFDTAIRQYLIKYVWSVKYPPGFSFRTADSGLFKKMQVIVRQGPPPQTNTWMSETVDLPRDFKKSFGDGDMPPIRGIGLCSDGNGVKIEVEADYADFELSE